MVGGNQFFRVRDINILPIMKYHAAGTVRDIPTESHYTDTMKGNQIGFLALMSQRREANAADIFKDVILTRNSTS